MTTLWGMMEKVLRTVMGQQKTSEAHWDIMFISDQGRVVRVKDFKRQVILLLLAMVTALVMILCCLTLYLSEKAAVDRVKSSLAKSQKTITSLVNENDTLVARLVALQKSKGKPNNVAMAAKQDLNNMETSGLTPKNNQQRDSNDQVSPDTPVIAVDNLSVVMVSGTDRIQIKFSLSKIDEQQKYVSGRIFVELERRGDNNPRLVVPPVHLVDGVPTRINTGQFFSIARYKPVIMTTRTDSQPDDFQKATVHIFTPEGEPIYQKTFPVTVRIVAPEPEPEPEPASTETADPPEIVSSEEEQSSPPGPQQEIAPAPTTQQTTKEETPPSSDNRPTAAGTATTVTGEVTDTASDNREQQTAPNTATPETSVQMPSTTGQP